MTRGERNNNPGNIRKSAIDWKGEVLGDDKAFETFNTPEEGIRALAVLLKNYYQKHGLKTVRKIINRYAPANENDTDAYIDAVCKDMEVMADQILVLSDTVLFNFVTAIIRHENGRVIYNTETIKKGIEIA